MSGVRGRSPLHGDIESYQKEDIPPVRDITLTMTSADINRALELTHRGENIRSVIHCRAQRAEPWS